MIRVMKLDMGHRIFHLTGQSENESAQCWGWNGQSGTSLPSEGSLPRQSSIWYLPACQPHHPSDVTPRGHAVANNTEH